MYYDEEDDYADEGVGELFEPEEPPVRSRRPPPPRKGRQSQKRKKARKRGKRFVGWVLALALIAGLSATIWFGARDILGLDYADYEGAGKKDIVVHVADGDSTRAIAGKLVEADVVASEQAFLEPAKNNDDIMAIRPGYYVVKTQMSGKSALRTLVSKEAKVGQLEIRSGTQLDDLMHPNGKKIPGIYSRMSSASCAELNGESTCVSTKKLRDVVAKRDLTQLGVPQWLADSAKTVPAERRLEGLVMPGLYDIKPGWDAKKLLSEVLSVSGSRLEAAGLPDGAKRTKRSAYEIVVLASMIEREAVKADFAKVSRVLYNRLAKNMRLEMDSTINYVLDRPHIRTTSADRAKPGPYNSYLNKTLPPTPISSPSPEAIEAAQDPATGPWLYFVKCEKSGLSCFTDDYSEHERNVKGAKQRGVW